ncbi:hypothetical protein L915_11601 [Phytophthora nicotianae]|uniref:Uncharacterized protein n=1 Tax=Phytophthora nicotianae TaxID=4792 RepID=W2IQW7_PHYNI|nr:hypothetical protein L915_11601 [Phytophthora nicotianae]ETL36510.1 hypothetical protein L916_11520 [Phytophthora nicotianae]
MAWDSLLGANQPLSKREAFMTQAVRLFVLLGNFFPANPI